MSEGKSASHPAARVLSAPPFCCAAHPLSGFALPARHVLHTVGPIYESDAESAPLLAGAYRYGHGPRCTRVALHQDLQPSNYQDLQPRKQRRPSPGLVPSASTPSGCSMRYEETRLFSAAVVIRLFCDPDV